MDQRYRPVEVDAILGRVIEEVGEVMEEAWRLLHALGKIERHGFQAEDPHTGLRYNNAAAALSAIGGLLRELADLSDALGEAGRVLKERA